MQNSLKNYVVSFGIGLLLFLHSGVEAHESLDGLRHCCHHDSLNYTKADDGEYLCTDQQPFNIECHGLPYDIIDYPLDEIRELDDYCYVHHSENETDVVVAGVCIEPYEVPLSINLLPISLVFLVLTFVVYYKIRTLRAPEDIAFMISVLCLAVFILIHVPHYWLSHLEGFHSVLSFLDLFIAQFAVVAYFAWLNVIMANQLRKNM